VPIGWATFSPIKRKDRNGAEAAKAKDRHCFIFLSSIFLSSLPWRALRLQRTARCLPVVVRLAARAPTSSHRPAWGQSFTLFFGEGPRIRPKRFDSGTKQAHNALLVGLTAILFIPFHA
jgi:hypothetical protein